MTQQTINIGSSPNKGDGDPLRTAFDKINDNFTELYARDLNTDAQTLTLVGNTLSISDGNSVTLDISPTGDLTGSVFSDDSALLVDGVNGNIVAPVLYNPITDSHWTDPNPTTVTEALDRLAASIYAVNGGSSI